MADIIEYVYDSAADTVFMWRLEDDAVSPGIFAATTMTPTRFVATLTPATGAAIVLDTDAVAITLDASGHFRWNNTTKVLTCAWGPLVPATIPLGSYRVALVAMDGTQTLGIRWGRQSVIVAVEA